MLSTWVRLVGRQPKKIDRSAGKVEKLGAFWIVRAFTLWLRFDGGCIVHETFTCGGGLSSFV